jgi:hypothetical protein
MSRSIAPRAFANDDDTAASLTFINSAFVDNIYTTFECDTLMTWSCYFTGPAGAAGLSTVSNAVFRGKTVFRNNTWGSVYVASPITIAFQGSLQISSNTKNLGNAVRRRRLHAAAGVALAGADPQSVMPQESFANGPVYGAGIFAAAGAHIFFSGITTCKDNQGIGGCCVTLDNATAIFAANKAVQMLGNSAPGTDGGGMALRATRNSSIVFRGPVVMADNWARSGAGGAVFLDNSSLTFHDVATLRNNSILLGPGMVSLVLNAQQQTYMV